jgi:HlyD family secretion protein
MQRRAKSIRTQTLCLFAFACCALAGVGVLAMAWSRSHARVSVAGRYFTTGVRRADLFPKLTASGRVESSKRTIIECDLENVAVGVRGQRLAAGGAAMLLSVIPEGTTVKRGDVLAVIDSSDYEELLRIQKIAVERSAADHVTAALDLDIAKLAVREFEKGTLGETIEDFKGRIFLARSDLERANDRVAWAHRMKDKGYIPAATVSSEDYKKSQMMFSLAQQQSAYELFVNFTAPKTLKVLEGTVAAADLTLGYQALRLARHRERYALLERQVEHCTIRAPHDGFVIYANNPDHQVYIEPGMSVRQRQQLFFLPDLSQMEVVALIHESIVERVTPSMRAHVQVEGIGNRSIEGHVTSIAPMTTFNWRTTVGYFEGIVKLENVPEGLKPGMSAEVEISMPRRENVLAVPTEAILIDHGYDICFVVHEDSLERRQVKLGNTTRDLVEVTQGLEDGEQVVLNPQPDDPELELLSHRGDSGAGVPSASASSSASSGAAAASH